MKSVCVEHICSRKLEYVRAQRVHDKLTCMEAMAQNANSPLTSIFFRY